ncbi:MAG: cell division protein SepF [Clostridia bacterium]|jgi:cell division inhibitor SepF|nr:cell division protein SepF [Clostridia bacterium]MDD3970410.1 cell division protein SepF [Clostridia bacterium]NLF35809.1 cell division protein SepF [Clostridiaceae bacterium]HXK71070.1 cell division protein SepF [Clostridia bacterium]
MSVFDKFLTEFLGFEQAAPEKQQVAPVTRDGNGKTRPSVQVSPIVDRIDALDQIASKKVVPMERSTGILNVMYPESFEETKRVCDSLKSGRAVIVNLEQIEKELAQRIVDFLSGTVYTLNGAIRKLSDKILVVAPSGYHIDDEKQDLSKLADTKTRTFAN